jgi:UDP-N-acetylmuramoylalanine--D-glutamate ligase
MTAGNNSYIVVLGGGESGVGAALLARQKGCTVFLSDGGMLKEKYRQVLQENDIPFEEGGHTAEKILSATEVVKSPGIPEKNELVKQIRAKGIRVISEIELAYRYKGNSRIIAITGSNGKSTTTSMIYHICKEAGLDCALVGNIGFSFAWQVAREPKALYVAEISSFQLDDIETFRPDVAVLLNITEDHLDRYNYDFKNYVNSKFRIIENQQAGDYFIYCDDDEAITGKLTEIHTSTTKLPFSMKHEVNKGGYIKGNQMTINALNERTEWNVNDFVLKGKHNQYNTMAATIACDVTGIRKEKVRDSLQTFESLEHRMEYVATVRGVVFINDSKATNVNSLWFALESMTSPTILIMGGVDKGNDYTLVEDLVREKVKAIVCLGTDNSKIREAFGNIVPVIVETNNAKAAVDEAFGHAKKGYVVLLSPACASFDLYKNYEDRGTQFKEAVKAL